MPATGRYHGGVRIAIVSDIHSNLDALSAVLRDAERHRALDGVWCLGDIVGYGAQPADVIDALRARSLTSVAGNHDLAACGRMGVEEFNPIAAEAALWSGEQLSHDARTFLAALPLTLVAGDFSLVHGSLRAPAWEYLLSEEQAEAQFSLQTTRYSLVGHSHLQFVFAEREGRAELHPAYDSQVVALADTRLILNPGSVGQPRDGDPRAAYLLYDDGEATMMYRRVEYDIRAAQRKIESAGLPPLLAQRLAIGR